MRPVLLRKVLLRHLPFTAMALVGQVSALWPPGPTNMAAYRISTGLLVVDAVLIAWRPGRLERTWLVLAAIYVTSLSFLMLAMGGINSGLDPLLLVPVVGVALYGEIWKSVAVTGFVLTAILAVSLASGPQLAGANPRRLVLVGGLAAMVSVGIHTLRRRLLQSNSDTRMLLELEKALSEASRELVQLSDPPAITTLGTELAARIVSSAEDERPRAGYFRIKGGSVTVDGEFGKSGQMIEESWLLDEHPYLREAVTTRSPLSVQLDLERMGPTVRSVLVESGMTHGALVPVCPDGVLEGVLSVSRQGTPISGECLDRLASLGRFLELALANWSAHEKLKEQATAEERRRIARELHDGLAHELAFIASKTRGSWAGPTKTELNVRELAGAADRALDEARRAITVLSETRPQTLEDAIAQTAEDLASRLGMAVDLELTGEIEVTGEVTENVLRIVREAITNAATHGRSAHVWVRLEQADRVHLVIEDDGSGFDPGADSLGTGFGLLSMRERATSIGAELEVLSAPHRGTRVTVTFG